MFFQVATCHPGAWVVEPAGFQNTGLEWPQLLRQHSLLNMNLEYFH